MNKQMMLRCWVILLGLSLGFPAGSLIAQTPPNSQLSSGSDYDQIISGGNAQLKAGDFQAAHNAAMKALGLDGNRFEAYALEALSLFKQGKADQARGFIEIALAKAPDSKTAQLRALAATIENKTPSSATPSPNTNSASPSDAPSEVNQLRGDDRLDYETLLSMLSDADKAMELNQRHEILESFFEKSGLFLKRYPNMVHLWIARAAVAVELDRVHEGWEAAQKLKALGLENSEDPKVVKVMVQLNEKGWLARQEPKPPDENPFTGDKGDSGDVAVINTTDGKMVVAFWTDLAPNTVANFEKLARSGFYDGTCFHRIIKGFMIQGGDPLTKDPTREKLWGTGGPGYSIKAEFNNRPLETGVIAMAQGSHSDSSGSQFFICDAAADDPNMQSNDGKCAAFGKLIKGEEVLERIADSPARKYKPLQRVGIIDIKIVPRE